MKNNVRLSTILCSAFFSAQLFAQTPIKDTVSMGPGYANAVYYNLRTGAKSQSAISTWHMSHTTVSRDNCIRLNHLNGVDVYAYPKGSNKDFSTMDTAGWSSWKHLYNDIHTHELGALNQSTNAKNPMDFSWGIYNSTTHEIEGDSLYLFVINTPSFGKSYLKFMPILQTATGDLIFRFARLNGSIDKTDTLLQSSFTGKSYKYYNFTKGAVQPEPIRENWDILFIRYMAPTTPPDGGPKVMYPTMGVESKRGERVSKITNYTWDVIAANPAQSIAGIKMTGTPGELSKDLTKIGGDWKAYDGAAMTWNISTDWNYIVETIRIQGTTKDTAFWLLAFTGFSGSAKGETQLKRMELKTSTAAVSQSKQFSAKLFPNPSSDNILIMANGISEKAIVQIIGMDGRLIHSNSNCEFSQGAVQLSVQDLPRGSYFVTIQTNNDKLSLPFIKQ
ncbi:hypothetical protein LBMAG26_04210 [Bacteroidota bacterium]|nr:hypothetical protein LBMAG26_04210 [Bacteroidota bacterium]